MLRTVLFLLLTLVVVPVLVYFLDVKPTPEQWLLIRKTGLVCLVFATTCFIVSTVSRNYSQVDKLWSVMPAIYAWIVAVETSFEPRILLMACLVTLWGVRLTYNFSRRGGYSWKFWTGDEDYRWAIVRAKPMFQKPWAWMLFNLFFISYYQMALILLFTLPIVKAYPGGALGAADVLLTILFVALVLVETIADQQQWNFQQEKHRRQSEGLNPGPMYGRGFAHTGLWGVVRHPNYAAEQGIWIVFYLFSLAAGGAWFNWSVTGVILLLLLFKSSSDFSESISAAKYPAYAEYVRTVGRFLPKPGSRGKAAQTAGQASTRSDA